MTKLSQLIYFIEVIPNLLPENAREGVTINLQDPTDLESTFLTDVRPIRLNIHATVIAGVSDVSDKTCKHPTISCTILYLYFLME